MTSPIAKLMARLVDDISSALERGSASMAGRIRRIAKHAWDPAEALRSSDAQGAAMRALNQDFEWEPSIEHAGSPTMGAGPQPARIVYHYTSAEGMAGILRTGKLRSSWAPTAAAPSF
ncbi:hypothetical protein ACQP2U_30455 [Nocardia sp. CA-084685]|uniref:hypothetical protein n=1 Tax=Nocardia sp. CA-084685 TaxID=3239970 RepID=UPI003D98DADE